MTDEVTENQETENHETESNIERQVQEKEEEGGNHDESNL